MANTYKNAFITNINSIPTSGDTLSLADTQLGVFNANTYAAVTAPTFPTVTAIIVAQGRDSRTFPKGVGLTNENPKSLPIKGQNIVAWQAVKSQKPQNMIVTLGFDGVDTSKTFAPPVGKDVNIYVTMSGEPIANLLGGSSTTHYNSYTEVFTPVFPCPDDCADNCGDTVDCSKAVDAFIDEFNKRKVIGGELLSKYIRVTKVTECDTPSGYPTTTCTKYQVVVPDNGDQAALGEVQAQYVGHTITRVAREGILSTYEAVYCSGSPDAFVNPNGNAIPNCTDCPSGYNYSAELPAFTVGRTDAGNATALTTFKADFGGLIVLASAVRLSYEGGYSVYQVFGNASTTLALMNTRAGVVAKGDVVTDIGSRQDICVGNAGLSYSWSNEGTCYKATKYYKLTYSDTPCGSNILSTLQALYTDIGTVAVTDTGDCVTEYTLSVQSDESCVDCGDQTYSFRVPDPYQGTPWVPQAGTPEGTGCVCGVRFESAYIQRERRECYFDEVSYEVEPLFIAVSTINPNTQDYSTLCDPLEEQIPVTKIQNIKYAVGYGSTVLSERVKLSNFYFNRPWKTDPAERDAMAYELGIDLQGYYDEYVLTYYADVVDGNDFSSFARSKQELHEDHYYVAAGEGTAFVQAINSYVASTTSITGVVPVVI